jgi:demethylmenaquinone methyltransferase/2-methoxy-6-polyprenyl-1,4-benzoquinol methylase
VKSAPGGPAHSDRNRFAKSLFSGLPSRYDRLAELLSFGQNRRWRKEMVDHVVPAAPRRVLDVASGTAGVAIQLTRRSGARVVAVDLSPEMLREGVRNVDRAGASARVDFVLGKGEQLPFADGSFDALTFTYLLRYVADPAAAVAEMARVVRPGGKVASLEFLVPQKLLWRAAWWCYTRLVLPPAGWLTGGPEWWRVGRFLGPNISGHYRRYPVDWTVGVWEQAGLEKVGVRRMSLGGGLVMWGRKSDG